MRCFFFIFIVVVTVVVASQNSFAALQFNPSVSLTAGLPGDIPGKPRVAYNSKHDEYLVVYQYSHSVLTLGVQQIHAARFSSAGRYIANYVIANLPHSCEQPDVAYDPVFDRYLVVWSYDPTGAYTALSWDIYGRFVPWCGPADTLTPFVVAEDMHECPSGPGFCLAAGEKSPRIVYSPTNKDFQVIMIIDDATAYPYIAGLRISIDGAISWQNLLLRSSSMTASTHPDIAYNSVRDEFMIVYDDTEKIYGVTVPGVQAEGVFEKNPASVRLLSLSDNGTPLAGIHQFPAVAFSKGAQYYMITWVTNRHINAGDLHVRYYPGGWNTPTTVYRDVLSGVSMNVYDIADVSCTANGNDCFAAWVVDSNGTFYTVGRQIILTSDSSGNLTGHGTGFAEFLDNLSSLTVWGAEYPTVAMGGGADGFYLASEGFDSSSIRRTFGRISVQDASAGWKTMATGDRHSLAVHSGGTLWAWGDNTYGQLGLGPAAGNFKSLTPRQVGVDSDWERVAAGVYTSFGIRSDGTLWSWGNYSVTPTEPQTGTQWSAVAAGQSHYLGIQSDGSLWWWGYVFVNNQQIMANFEQIGTEKNWVAVSAGQNFSLALKADGTLWAWGDNLYGQLGQNTFGENTGLTDPTQIGTDTTWRTIAAGRYHCLAIKQDNFLWSWGLNGYGRLGLGDLDNRYSPTMVGFFFHTIAAGAGHSLATRGLLAEGQAWGSNSSGQLGQGDTFTGSYKTAPITIAFGPSLRSLAAKHNHSLALSEDGRLYGWGENTYGQLGLGDTDNRNYPTEIKGAATNGTGFPWALFFPSIQHAAKK
ncbi:RCC1 domain-containing protein [Desulfogranum japonicum]|uniref:RCC1 domain-containing protein n=1 Tax=Desulfogranum japonicum TaxID=231447 RepID=UPI0005503ECA|nr:hypothetical protein [Desulfogranum japonicum]